MTEPSRNISKLLEKMANRDKDFRYMALNDLIGKLQSDNIKLDDNNEQKVVRALIQLLENDKNGEVQNLAVKGLGPIIRKFKDNQVQSIVDTLCKNMTSSEEKLRDISSIGLKTVINELPQTQPQTNSPPTISVNICKRITEKIKDAIKTTNEQSVLLESLDILSDLLSKFGSHLTDHHREIKDCVFPLLTNPRLAIRKRSIGALSYLVTSAKAELFEELMRQLILQLENENNLDQRTNIQCIGSICRQSGHRVGDYLNQVIPQIIGYSMIENDDELRETCIQALESFVRKCPKEVTDYIERIKELCLKYLSYDPNYNYGDDDDQDMDDEMNASDEENEDEEEEEYSDDDDMSWKVRRASAKCLGSIINSRHELLAQFYQTLSPKLIARFKEREENVKSDIFNAYVIFLRQTRTVASSEKTQDDGPLRLLAEQIASIVNALHRQMQDKSVKTRQGVFALFTELVTVSKGALSSHIDQIVPGIMYSLKEKNSQNIKIEALSFLACLLGNHQPEVFFGHILELLPCVIASIKDSFYKIVSEGLVVAERAVTIIKCLDKSQYMSQLSGANGFYTAVFNKFKATDIDQEIKEKAITCMAEILCHMGDSLASELPSCLPIYIDRLKNEITRLTTVRAVCKIASSALRLDLSIILNDVVPMMATFLRKNHRALKLSTLECLDVLLQNYGGVMSQKHYEDVLQELPPLINDGDLQISQLTLKLLTSITTQRKQLVKKIQKDTLPQVILLTQSPLLHDKLSRMKDFLKALIASGEMLFNDLLEKLYKAVYKPHTSSHLVIHKLAFYSIAACTASLTLDQSDKVKKEVVLKFIKDVEDPKSSDSVRLYALLTLGEIGAKEDLSGLKELHKVIIDTFSVTDSEEVKYAASYSLGHLCVGNLNTYLPFILEQIRTNTKRQYFLLNSLKWTITCPAIVKPEVVLEPFLKMIWDLLFLHCESKEEGTRNLVAECLGKLTLIDPRTLLVKLQANLSSESAVVRCAVITAVKFTITDQQQSVDAYLKQCIHLFLEKLADEELNVQRVSLALFNSTAHNKPGLIRDFLPKVLPHLYDKTKVRKELIRDVEMGPFKHTVDDGLDIRKAAFECMYTLLDSCLDRLDIFQFLSHVEGGLSDHYDIKMLTYLMLVRLSKLCPDKVLQNLDTIVEPLRVQIQAKVKANSVKQESEKLDELKKSVFRALLALRNIPDAEKNKKLEDFISQIEANPDTKEKFEEVQRDTSTTATPSASSEMMEISS